jgi:hypothetical protein
MDNHRMIFAAALITLTLILCGACSTTRYVPVESVRVEYRETDTTGIYKRLRNYFESIYHREVSTDSVVDRSKETVVLKENGDTARHDKERIIYVSSRREKELEHRVREQDSIINILRLQLASVKSDSIPVPYPVEKKLTQWEQTKMDLGGFALGGIAVALCIVVVWLIKKFRK